MRYLIRFISRTTESLYYVTASSAEEAVDACKHRLCRNGMRVVILLPAGG